MKLESIFCFALTGVTLSAAEDSARIADLERRLQELDQKYRALEQRVGESGPSKAAPAISIGATGVSFHSADTNYVIKFHGLLQLDSHWYFEGGGNDTFLLRRARPLNIEGTFFKDVDFLFVPDFANGRAAGGTATASPASVVDAYLNYRFKPELQLRIGKFKEPVGLEELQSDSQAYFIERSLLNGLMPNRDLGIMLHGDVAQGFMTYALGVFNGVADGGTTGNIDFDDQKDFAGRIFFQPFIKSDFKPLRGLGLGFGASVGSREGAGAIGSYATESVTTFFSYNTGVIGDGRHLRWSPQMYYFLGPFGLIGEYAVSSQEVRLGAARGTMDHRAWQLSSGFVLTGEDAGYKGVVPKNPLSLVEGHFGAFELTGRYSHLDMDDQAFPIFASPTASATEADAFTVGLNWFLNRNLRTAINYVQTDFKGGTGNPATKGTERTVLTRFQVGF
jgi:phosphate-selective porin OprO/OprP